jgi:hypothetical protein
MPRLHDLQPSFNAGELSPRLAARTDFDKYKSGVETLENMIPLAEGGALRRAGTRYVAATKTSSVKSRLKRFEFNTEQAYILEMGEQYMRFIRNQQQITVADTDAAISNGDFTTDLTGWFSRTPVSVTNTDISFTATSTITSGSSEFGVFATTDFIQVEGSASNDSLRKDIFAVVAFTITTNETDITTEGAGASVTVTKTLLTWNASGYMDIEHDGTDAGIAEQAITTTSTGVEHVIMFEVVGPPGRSLTVRVGSTSGASDYLADFVAEVGYHAIAFTPTASPMYLQFENHIASTTIGVDSVSLIDNAPLELQTIYSEAELFQIEGPQSADVLYMFHPDNPTYKLERRGDTTWSLIEVEWEGGPWLDLNLGTTTLAPSATTGLGITVTASAVDGINDGQGFLSSDLYRLIRIDNPASGVDWGWGRIVGVTSTTVVTVDVQQDFARTNADTRWRLGAWSATTGFPSKGTFFQERLYTANTATEPQSIWASQTGDFQNMIPDSDPTTEDLFDGTIEDDDALKMTLSADNVNVIRWLRSTRAVMSVGTAGGEWIPESQGVVITPNDRTITRQTTHGSANVEPVLVDNAALFVQRAKRRIRQFIFTFESDGFEAFDMNRLARHVIQQGVVEMDFAEEPDSLLWAVRTDGILASMTFRSQEDVVGWARHIIGGTFGTGNAIVESVAVIPGAAGAGQVQASDERDEVWVQVKRTINGNTVRYIEVLERDYEDTHDQEDAYYSDSLNHRGGPPRR